MIAMPESFYGRDTAIVARELLGKRLVRKLGGDSLESIIVETEAYFGGDDPPQEPSTGRRTTTA